MASEESKALALAAKTRGNELFAKKSTEFGKKRENYEQALIAYEEAITHDPEDHVFYANCSACHIELGNDSYEPKKKVESFARALLAARQCTTRGPAWPKGYVRQSAAEFELISATAKWEDRKIQDVKWAKEDEERAEKDRKEGREPFPKSSREKESAELDAALKEVVDGASYASCEASCRKGVELDAKNALLRSRLQALRDAGHATDEVKDKEMCDKEAAAAMKALGNPAFSGKKWKEAAEFYTQAMEQDPFDHVFYSNRSACYAESEEFDKAIRDAERCIALNPQFAKGYSRQAAVLWHVGRYVEMEAAAKKGLEIDEASTALQDLLKQAQKETCETPECQASMHQLRQDKKKDAKLQDLMKGLNMGGMGGMGGPGVQMFNPGDNMDGFLNGLRGGGGMGGMGGMGGFGGEGKSRMTEEQMRGMARAMSSRDSGAGAGYTPAAAPTPAAPPAAAPAAATGPASFGPSGPASFGPK